MPTRSSALVVLPVFLMASMFCGVPAKAGQPESNVVNVVVDFDGDGRADNFELRLRGRKVVATAIMGSGIRRQIGEFEAEDLACSPVTWVRECVNVRPKPRVAKMDASMRKEFGEMFDLDVDMLATSRSAQVLEVPVGETDPLWFFWNRREGEIQWTRL